MVHDICQDERLYNDKVLNKTSKKDIDTLDKKYINSAKNFNEPNNTNIKTNIKSINLNTSANMSFMKSIDEGGNLIDILNKLIKLYLL